MMYRQAPGGHDILSGLFDSLKDCGGIVVGFVGGAEGLIHNHAVELTAEKLQHYRSQGGFELLSRSQDSLPKESYAQIKYSCIRQQLDGLVLIGGAKTSTTAGYLSEWFAEQACTTKIISVPVDIAGSLKDEFIETTVGFDTATKIAGQVAGNNATGKRILMND